MTSTGTREAIAGARRIVVKIGSSSLTRRGEGSTSTGLDEERIDDLVGVLGRRAEGSDVVLVSSGAIATGLTPLSLTRRPTDLATQQAAASVGQGLLIAHYTRAFARFGRTVGQILLTAEDMTRRSHYRNAAQTVERLLELGVIPVVNENDTVATDEIRFGDNDRLAALVAQLIRADALILLSDVDGLYDGPPGTPGATMIPVVASAEDLASVTIGGTGSAGVGLGGMVTKVEAAAIATAAGIPVVLTSAANAAAAVAGDPVGTLFQPTGARTASRLLWLAHATSGQGRIVVDDGAVRALTTKHASLLPAGITGVEGTFSAGDPVDIVAADGSLVARGLVTYDAIELPALLGRSTRDLAETLGAEYEREVVHCDDLVLLGGNAPSRKG